MRRLLAIALMWTIGSFALAQNIMQQVMQSSAVNTWTYSGNELPPTSCGSANPCSATLGYTTTIGDFEVIMVGTGNGSEYITAVSGGATTWTIPSSCQVTGTAGSVSGAYGVATSGVTSISISFTTNTTHYVNVSEYSFTNTPVSDAIGTVTRAAAPSPQTLVGLTLTGTSDLIIQAAYSGGFITNISSPYTRFSSSSTTQFNGGFVVNTSSGTAPTATISSSADLVACGMAWK